MMKLFSTEEVQALLGHSQGVNISVFMPTRRSGAETLQNKIRFKNLIHGAERRLLERGLARGPELNELMKPAYDLIDLTPYWQHQSDGLAVFIGPGFFREYRVPIELDELVTVSERFYVKPLLRLLTGNGRFYALGVSLRGIRLYEGTRDRISEIDLGETPTDMRDVVGYEVEERHLQFHTGAGATTGGGGGAGRRAAVFHGHGGGKDDIRPEIRKFFSAVDHGLRGIIPDRRTPLVLVGIEHLLPIFREASSYPALADEELRHNPADLAVDEIRRRSWLIIEPYFTRQQHEARDRYQQLAGTGHVSGNLTEVVPAAADGRVEVLFLSRGSRAWGSYDPGSRRVTIDDQPGSPSTGAGEENGSRELLDFAAVETLANRGTVYVVDTEEMPEPATPIGAIFRY